MRKCFTELPTQMFLNERHVSVLNLLLVVLVELRDGTPALHLQKVLHVGFWFGAAVHQHDRGSPTGETTFSMSLKHVL